MEVLTGPPKDTHRSEHQEIVFLYHLGQGDHVFAFHAHCSGSQEEYLPHCIPLYTAFPNCLCPGEGTVISPSAGGHNQPSAPTQVGVVSVAW